MSNLYDTFETIDVARLQALPVFSFTSTDRLGYTLYYKLQNDMGNGCFLNAPGYPSYFTQCVYDRSGNSPDEGPQKIIAYNGVGYIVEHSDDWKASKGKHRSWDEYHNIVSSRLRSLWKPLPLDDERVQDWIAHCFAHLHNCYRDPATSETVIYPVPGYKLEHFRDDPRFSNEWREQEKARIEEHNEKILADTALIATIDNHEAIIHIREFYPDYVPTAKHLSWL